MSKQIRTAALIFMILLSWQSGISNGAESIIFKQGAINISTTLYGGFLIDRDGFVWIGTTGLGVYRYDGYELKSFAASIQGSMISSIVEDRDGVIWIASFSEGITSYDKKTGLFTGYRHDPDNANSLSSNNMAFSPQKLYVDKSNSLWAGTDDAGLSEYNKTTDTWTRHTHNPDDSNSLSDNAVMAIVEGKDGTLWAGTQRGGLNRLNRATETWTHYRHAPDDPNSLSDNWINSILEDRNGVLWIGTKKGGLNRFDKERGTFSHYAHDPNDPRSIGGNDVWSIHEDHAGRIWMTHIGSPSSGLELFDKKSGTFTRYGHDPNDSNTVSSNSISRVYEDRRTKTMWVTNHDGRIDRHDKYITRFRHWPGAPGTPNSLSNRSILPIIEDSNDIVWVGTFSGGLNSIDRETGKITHYLPDQHDPHSIPRSRVTALREDNSEVLWVGFWDGILASFDRKTGRIIRSYENAPGDPHSITESERLKYILEDRDDPNILWLATIKGGFDKFDKRRESFTHYKHNSDSHNTLSHDSMPTLYDDGKGVLWIPTYGGGLDKFDKKTETFTNYRHEVGNPNSLGSDTLYEVLETSGGELWVARKGGLSYFDPKSGNFKNFDRDAEGIPFGPVVSLLQDDEKNLWLGTIDRGLVRFDPTTGATKRFTVDDGLQGNTFFWTSRLKAKNGEMWFGGSNGISSFYPSRIRKNPHVPSIVLTAFTQGGNPVNTGTSPERLRKVILDWRSNYFEFQFAALNFAVPENNRYAYMLKGWDEEWYYSGSNPFGRYSRLAGGHYTLRLKGSNNNGVWNDNGVSVTVIVTPPLWETGRFAAAVAAVGLTILLLVVFYMRKLRGEVAERKQAEDELRHLRNYLSNIINSMPSVMIGVDNDGNVTQWNREAQRTTGVTADDAVGQPLAKTFPRLTAEMERVRQAIHSRQTLSTPKQTRQEDGEIRHENVTVYPLIANGLEGAVIRVDDVTERVRMQEMMIQSEKMLSVGGLAAGMAHEINNPLGGMMQTADVMSRRLTDVDLPANQRAAEEVGTSMESIRTFMEARGIIRMLGNIRESGRRAAEIVRNMLSFARKDDSTFSTHNLTELLDQAVDLAGSDYDLKKKFDFRRIEIVRAYENNLPLVACESSKIQQVFLNILRNGAEAMQTEAEQVERKKQRFILRLAHESEADRVRIEITDNGPGMDEAARKRAFEPFFTTKPVGMGTGLGLSVSYFIITKNHGGEMSVESTPGEGTTFIINLPVERRS